MAKDLVGSAGEYAQSKGLEIVLELEPFEQALLKDVDELVRFVRELDHPAVRANADISHLHLSHASFDDVAKLKGLIGHIHLSDCDGKVHGDLPAGRGVTPIKEYLAAIRDTGYDGTVSIELEYSPDPEQIVEWADEAYTGTAQIMRELGVRA
jgi:D-psicose/D-tagatose/L-ribulose 3-epimerase